MLCLKRNCCIMVRERREKKKRKKEIMMKSIPNINWVEYLAVKVSRYNICVIVCIVSTEKVDLSRVVQNPVKGPAAEASCWEGWRAIRHYQCVQDRYQLRRAQRRAEKMFSYQMITTFSSPKRKKKRKTGDGMNWLLPPFSLCQRFGVWGGKDCAGNEITDFL